METSGIDTVSSPAPCGSKPILRENAWLPAAIVLLALALRVAWLGIKPAHFDEGVNGWFVDDMTRKGFYHYDPGNFHGPLHFYLLFVAQTLFGRHVWALRLPVVLFSTGCVAMVYAFRRYLGARVCHLTALAVAVSPGMVFYGRYAIHESEQIFFMMLVVWGGLGLLSAPREPAPQDNAEGGGEEPRTCWPLWAAALGVTGMVLTKETYVIHLAALLLAFPALWILERFSPSAAAPFRQPNWRSHQDSMANAALVSIALIVFFYTGGLLDWSSLPGLWETFAKWGSTGTSGASGHEKPWYYWLQLLVQYEWFALVGFVAIAWLLRRGKNRLIRYLAIASVGTLVAYSGISYKTPWCVISITWPLFFVFGYVVDRAADRFGPWRTWPVVAVFFLTLLFHSDHEFPGHDYFENRFPENAFVSGFYSNKLPSGTIPLNFSHFANDDEPYAYVQTTVDVRKLLDPLRWLTRHDPVYYHLPGHILIPIEESHPLPWLLGDFTQIDYLDEKNAPAQMDATFLLVDDSIVSDTEERLNEPYFKDSFLLRGSSGQFVTLYLQAKIFAPYFPGRSPEFHPHAGPAKEIQQEADK